MRSSINRIVATIATTTALVGVAGVVSAGSASAAVDHRKCVTSGEARQIVKGMAQSRMFTILDGHGTRLTQRYLAYDDGYWVEDGYWDSTWVDGYYDWYWNGYEYVEYWVDGYWDDEWIDASYWQEDSSYLTDAVRSYNKCGGGKFGVDLDNYSSNYSGMRVYSKTNHPSTMAAQINEMYDYYSYSARSGLAAPSVPDLLKDMPKKARPEEPKSEPTTPDPHPNSADKDGNA